MGVEPCSNGFGREQVKDNGELILLQPGASRTYSTTLSIIDSAGASRLHDRVAKVASES